ncbi:cyclin-domain-containing protein [Globomyces pollinis-pini]|nr:cyclin-domain-containing protein [Globomyces pollinis-pini]
MNNLPYQTPPYNTHYNTNMIAQNTLLKHSILNHSRLLSDVAFSKSIVSEATMAPYFPQFIATFIYSLWHDQSFSYLTNYPTAGLLDFIKFIINLLKATKLPFSVIILSLKYIHRIKSRCPHIQGNPGSEYRLFVCTLNLAMKYLVDNTYSNKTWCKVSKIPLQEINIAEFEFIAQLNYDLHLGETKYFAWLVVLDDAFAKYRSLIDAHANTRQCVTPPLDAHEYTYLPCDR